jgi:II/X family phage/plasmid replication protein
VIDWLTFTAPLPHANPITSGVVLSVDQAGNVEWQTMKRQTLRGSFESGLQVRTCTHTADQCSHIEVSGNPVKLFQGHNLWGTDDLPALVTETLEFIASKLQIPVTDATRASWSGDAVKLTRVDLTDSFHLRNLGECQSWLRAAEQSAHLSHRGRGQLVKGSTLYFGKNSRRWSLKIYSKGQEIGAAGHGQEAILSLPHAVEWANRTLRAELTLRSMELKRRGLETVTAWLPVDGVPFDALAMLREVLGDMTMTTTAHLSAEVLETLRPALRTAVIAWEAGADLRVTLSRPTFYRYRAELLKHGIDIAVLKPREVSNVVPLHRVLEAVPARIPQWAIGTPLYFEPRRVA